MIGIRLCYVDNRLIGPIMHKMSLPLYFHEPIWKAACDLIMPHKAPNVQCTCGLYAYDRPVIKVLSDGGVLVECENSIYGPKNVAIVIVECLGKTIKHDHESDRNVKVVRSEIQIPQVIYTNDKVLDIYDCPIKKLKNYIELCRFDTLGG